METERAGKPAKIGRHVQYTELVGKIIEHLIKDGDEEEESWYTAFVSSKTNQDNDPKHTSRLPMDCNEEKVDWRNSNHHIQMEYTDGIYRT